MKIHHGILLAALWGAVHAESELTVKHFGWVNADYAYSNDVFADSNGSDRLGTAQAALGVRAGSENAALVVVIGADALSTGGSGPVIGIKDAFIDWDKIAGTGLGLSLGAQAFLFGLKAAGFPGDHSIAPSIEFGGAGAYAVSQQAGPSVKLRYDMMGKAVVTLGVFDNNLNNGTGAGAPSYGSNILENQFLQLTLHDLGVAGLYGFAGAERAYVGGAVDEAKPIFDVGAGFKQAFFDLSAEYIHLDRDIFLGKGLFVPPDDESYIVTELTVTPWPKFAAYADYARADQLDAQTVRVGAKYNSHECLAWVLEWSLDDGSNSGGTLQTVAARAHFAY